MRAPLRTKISLISCSFFGKFHYYIQKAPPADGCHLLLEEILDPPLYELTSVRQRQPSGIAIP